MCPVFFGVHIVSLYLWDYISTIILFSFSCSDANSNNASHRQYTALLHTQQFRDSFFFCGNEKYIFSLVAFIDEVL